MKIIELKLLSIITQNIPGELANQFIKLFVYYLQHNFYSDEQVIVDIFEIVSQLLSLVDKSNSNENYIWMLPIIIPLLYSKLLRKGFIKILKAIKSMTVISNNENLVQQINCLKKLNNPGTDNIKFETFDKRLEEYNCIQQLCKDKKLFKMDMFKTCLLTNDYFITKKCRSFM